VRRCQSLQKTNRSEDTGGIPEAEVRHVHPLQHGNLQRCPVGLRADVIASTNWWDWRKKGTPYADIAVKEMRPFPETNTAPGETCWCLEQGWFWEPGASPKTANEIVELITAANSRNSNFLLNVGPDQQGRFEESSVKVLAEIRKLLIANEAEKK
jgi:alpha-L-fucosidase